MTDATQTLITARARAVALAVLNTESDAWTPREWSQAAIDLASAVVAVSGDINKVVLPSEQAELERLREEATLGPQPHRCDNAACPTVTYGAGYDACPKCGGTEGRDA